MRGHCLVCGDVRQLVAHEGEGLLVTGQVVPVGTCQRCTEQGVSNHAVWQAENSPWENVVKKTEPRLTTTQAYTGKRLCFDAWSEWRRAIIKLAYPDTGGTPLYLHNWHIVGNEDSEARALNERLWNLWYRVDRLWTKAATEADHHEHHGDDFAPHWCEFCKAAEDNPAAQEVIDAL